MTVDETIFLLAGLFAAVLLLRFLWRRREPSREVAARNRGLDFSRAGFRTDYALKPGERTLYHYYRDRTARWSPGRLLPTCAGGTGRAEPLAPGPGSPRTPVNDKFKQREAPRIKVIDTRPEVPSGEPDAPSGTTGDGRGFDALQEQSPLAILGYRVGKSSNLLPRERREILRCAANDFLPNAYDANYAQLWGEPMTRKRLLRIIEHLDYLIDRSASQRRLRQSVSDWRSDRAWLSTEFSARLR